MARGDMPDIDRYRKGLRLLSGAIASYAEATSDYGRLLDTVARNMVGSLADASTVLLAAPNGDLQIVALHAFDADVRATIAKLADIPIRADEPSTAHEVMRTGQPILVPVLDIDAMRSRMTVHNWEFLRDVGARGLMTVSMVVQGQPVGVVSMFRYLPESRSFDELDLELARDLANHAALAIANARLVDALRETDELRRAKAETAAANLFLDAIIEHIPDMVFVKEATRLAFTRFNRAGEELLGVPRSALIGKTDYDMFPAAEAAFFQDKDRETLRGKTLVEIAEEPIQTAHGQRWLHTKKVPILDDHGTPVYLLGISHDITERKHADAELRTAKEQVEAANRELEAFSYSVAHDLRAPLRGIDGFSQALLEDYGDKLDAEGHRHLARVREAAQRMALLIDDLLGLSRVTRAELRSQRIDLSALALGCVERLQRSEPARQIELVIAPGLVAHADPRLLSVALDNLLGNAWKFTSKSPHARIELGATPREGRRMFYVRDNGAGFDMTYVRKLFGVFQRLHIESEFPGTGIGLATVARIIHRHGGQVSAEGVPGAGATFYFTLSETETP